MQAVARTAEYRTTETEKSIVEHEASQLVEVILTGLNSAGWVYDPKFTQTLSPRDLLLNLPEALEPELYYPWVREALQEVSAKEAEAWIISRVIGIDQAIGRLDLCIDILNYGVSHLGLSHLQPEAKKVEWLQESNCDLMQQGVSLIYMPLQRLIEWNYSQVAENLHEQVLLGLSPRPLVQLIIHRGEVILPEIQDVCALLDFPVSEKMTWKDFKLDFIKACLIATASLPLSVSLVSGLLELINEGTEAKEMVSSDSLMASYGDVQFLRNLESVEQAYPLVQFLSTQVEGWAVLEKHNISLQRLSKTLNHFLVATPSQHHRWLQRIVRSVSPSLRELKDVMSFWEDMQLLAALGHFGSTTPSQVLSALVEGLLSCDAYRLVSRMTQQEAELPISSNALEVMALTASQERFVNLSELNSLTIRECFDPLVIAPSTPAITKWRAFINGAYKLTQTCKTDRVSPLPMPVEIHIDPQAQLRNIILHPRCKLYIDINLCHELAGLLGVSDYPIYSIAVSAAVQRGDFSSAYVNCLSLMQDAPDVSAFDVCLDLASNAAFRDFDKRLRLVSIALSTCPPSQFAQWLNCYRELEAAVDTPGLPSEAHELFVPDVPLSQATLEAVFKERPIHRRPKLSSHPMYASEISGMGDDFYDGTLAPSLVEQDFRLLSMAADCREDPSVLSTPAAFEKWRRLLEASDAHLFQVHLVHVPQDKRQQILEKHSSSPEAALQAAYIYFVSLLPQVFDPESCLDTIPNFLTLQPAQVLKALESHYFPQEAFQDSPLQGQMLLAEKAYASASEIAGRNKLSELLQELAVDPVKFYRQSFDGQLNILKDKASTLDLEQLDLVLKIADMAHFDQGAIRLATIVNFFVDSDASTQDFWTQAIEPHLGTIDTQSLHDHLFAAYPQLDGSHASSLQLFFRTLIDINKKLTQPHPIDQLQIRKMLLDDWNELVGARRTIDFKAIIASFLAGSLVQLQSFVGPLLEYTDTLVTQIPQLLALVPLFEGEEDAAKPTEAEFASLIYRWGFEQLVNSLKASAGLVLVDDIGDYAKDAFSSMTPADLLDIFYKLCGPASSDAVPLATAQFLLQTGLDFCRDPDFLAKLEPIQSRLNMLQLLSDLADPATEEDLGFSIIKLIDDTSFQDPEAIKGLFLQLLKDRISPWLLENLGQLLPAPSPSHTEALSFLIKASPEACVDIIAGFGAQLNLYTGALSDWAEALRVDIKEMLIEEILPDSELDPSLREELLVVLFNEFSMDTDEGILLLLEWRCSLMLGQSEHVSLESRLELPSALGPQALVIISRYFQYLKASDTITSEISDAWMQFMSGLASDPSTSPSLIYQLWIFICKALDAKVLKEKTQPFLQVLRNYHPLAYFQIGLGLPDTSSFEVIALEFLDASHYDLGINDDPLIFALLLSRGKTASLVLSCPNLFKEELVPLLTEDLAFPAFQQHVLRSLLMNSDADVQSCAELIPKEIRQQFPSKLPSKDGPGHTQRQPKLTQISSTPVPMYDDSIPTIDELSELLVSPPLPEFPPGMAPYLAHALSSYLPHQK
ncbi:hypothetical protein DSO57_1000054 [Entomophthora muscae]|uniref:Uncharacterized protein n=1 Tax=Entomophthora muscae TaxID=34485 RepID=A0ACC2SMA9_9FUNG|nr:hypothetical protein DSO57_1000054 [Entomophthora muscae]